MAQEALEALQLEKRLSLLSHSCRPGSAGRAGGGHGLGGRRGSGAAPWSLSATSKLLFIHLFLPLLAIHSLIHSFSCCSFIHSSPS